MKRLKKAKPAAKSAAKRSAGKARRRPVRASTRKAKGARPTKARTRPQAPPSPYSEAIRAMQDAAASLTDSDVIDILSDLSWPNRAKWLSSYFADQLPEEMLDEGDGVGEAIDDIGAQVAALLAAMEDERPTDFLHAVTCCFSADPAHVRAGEAWLRDNLGTQTIDLDTLEGLPGYQAVAEIVDRVKEESGAT